MGCDAHPVIEVRRDGEWTFHESENHYYGYRGWGEPEPEDEEEEEDDYDPNSWQEKREKRPGFLTVFGDRNYTAFSVLADVRNYGKNNVAALFPNRGMPDDASERAKLDIPADHPDLHSHTYFTVGELEAVDWDGVAAKGSDVFLTAAQFKKYLKDGKVPTDAKMWAPWDTEISEKEMTLLLLSEKPSKIKKLVRVQADVSYRHLVPEVIGVIPELKELGDEVRVIIAYDN